MTDASPGRRQLKASVLISRSPPCRSVMIQPAEALHRCAALQVHIRCRSGEAFTLGLGLPWTFTWSAGALDQQDLVLGGHHKLVLWTFNLLC
ncbi:hypothetical protein D4764_02G0000170 [Takifugu flavidus]|uniref:Uncharacterized protein n=1 Tax=Takifugu flavidus TaxID=433684 RepID=A0A5C6NIN9_9TELE|nr:hypothetical protein D4764_02G0000170 [Takifugu flavidus]